MSSKYVIWTEFSMENGIVFNFIAKEYLLLKTYMVLFCPNLKR